MLLTNRHLFAFLTGLGLAGLSVIGYFTLAQADVLAANCPAGPIVGEIRIWTTDTPPDCWKFANGDSLTVANYDDLFDVIDYDFGGSGQNFNLPDLRDKFPLGAGTGHGFNTSGGAETVTLTQAQMPAHTHTFNSPDGGSPPFAIVQSGSGASLTRVNAGTSSSGGSQSHNNMPPYLTLHYIIFVGKKIA